MRIVTVVGARPQFIKAAVGSRQLRKSNTEILVHTGQHHDANMSDVFFNEMGIPKPDYNLGIAGGTHGEMTGRMLIEIEHVLMVEKPDLCLVYGDTNSTLAAALAAAKLHIPVAHIESGNRFGTLDSPEEVNRIVTDHVSTLRFACTESALNSLRQENLGVYSFMVGDPMYDAFLYYAKQSDSMNKEGLIALDGRPIVVPDNYYYLTCHRQENTDNRAALNAILQAMETLDAPTVYPVHPRNRRIVEALSDEHKYRNIRFVQPVGYLSSICLIKRAKKVITDSGGVQREAFFAGKQCITVLDYVVWPETMVGNRNQLVKPDMADILGKMNTEQKIEPLYQPFGDGHAAERINEILCRWGREKT